MWLRYPYSVLGKVLIQGIVCNVNNNKHTTKPKRQPGAQRRMDSYLFTTVFSNHKSYHDSQTAVGWTEETCLRMAHFAAEDHSYVATLAEIKRYENTWGVNLNKAATRHLFSHAVTVKKSWKIPRCEQGSSRCRHVFNSYFPVSQRVRQRPEQQLQRSEELRTNQQSLGGSCGLSVGHSAYLRVGGLHPTQSGGTGGKSGTGRKFHCTVIFPFFKDFACAKYRCPRKRRRGEVSSTPTTVASHTQHFLVCGPR